MALENTPVHKGAEVCTIPYFLGKTPCQARKALLSSPEDARKYRGLKVDKNTMFPESVHYLLSIYATSEVINEA